MKKVIFNEETNEYFGDYGNGKVQITRDEWREFMNQNNIKCLGSEDGYIVYEKCR